MKTSIRVIDEAIATKTSSLNNLVAEKERLLNNTLQIQEQINNTAHDIENLQYEVRLMKNNYGAVDCNTMASSRDEQQVQEQKAYVGTSKEVYNENRKAQTLQGTQFKNH